MKIFKLASASLLILILFGGAAFGYGFTADGNPTDTPANTPLTSEGSGNKANYRDININPRDLVTGADTYGGVVTSEYGWSAPDTDSADIKYTTRGVPQTWVAHLLNEGNAPYTFSITYETGMLNGAVGWSIKQYLISSETERLEIASGTQFILPDNDDVTFETVITPSPLAANSPDGSIGGMSWSINNVNGVPHAGTKDLFNIHVFWYYTGVNSKDYGGALALTAPSISAQIQTPVITLSRTATIDSPDGYVIGTKHDPVPGSLYTMSLLVSNEGSGTADKVVVIDKIPDNMVAYKVNVQEPEDNVDVTAPGFADDGVSMHNWWVYYSVSSEVELDRSYDGAGWVYFTGASAGGAIPSEAKFIKFQKNDAGRELATQAWARLQWSCYIK